jgi:putative ABC transport system permease protein
MAASLDGLRIPRFLTQNKAFAACVVFSLGVGISVAAAVVAIVESVRNGPVPFANAERIEVIYVGDGSILDRRYYVAPEIIRALTAPESPIEDAALSRFGSYGIRDGEHVVNGWILEVTPNYPRMLSARMHIGRPFGVGDSPEERHLMLSHRLWTKEFHSDSTIVGRTVFLDAIPHVVVGVTARDWSYPERIGAWASNAAMLATFRRHGNQVEMLALRKSNIDAKQARIMISTIGTAAMTTRSSPQERVQSESLRDRLTLGLSQMLFALGLVAMFVGFITAVNFAALVLARGIKRREEIAVRAALGASVGRLVRQIVGETVWLSAAGGVLAALLAPAVLNTVLVTFDRSLPLWLTLTLSWRVLLASVAISMLLGVVFALGPALDLARPALSTFLHASWAGVSAAAGAQRSRAGLVTIQVGLATAFLVLFGALLGRTLILTRVDPGYDYERIITGSIARERRGPTKVSPAVLANAEQLQGVTHAALVQARHLWPYELTFDGATGDTAAFEFIWAAQTSEAFFSIAQPTLVAGRLPTPEEYRGRAPVAVVTEVVARRVFDGEAIGKTIRVDRLTLTVIGVLSRFDRTAWDPGSTAAVISPIVDAPNLWTQPELWLRVGDASQVQPILRDLQQRSAMNLLGARIRFTSLGVEMRDSKRAVWAVARIIYAIFGIALALAAIGIYGLVSYTVEMRNREMAIREALGASRVRVSALLLRSAIIQTLVGVVAGSAFATVVASLIRNENLAMNTAAGATVIAFIVVALTVLASSFGPLRATWRRDLSAVLRQ